MPRALHILDEHSATGPHSSLKLVTFVHFPAQLSCRAFHHSKRSLHNLHSLCCPCSVLCPEVCLGSLSMPTSLPCAAFSYTRYIVGQPPCPFSWPDSVPSRGQATFYQLTINISKQSTFCSAIPPWADLGSLPLLVDVGNAAVNLGVE